MDPAIAGGLAVTAALAALAAVVTRRRRRARWVGPGRLGGGAGVREPRRPLVPAGAAAVALPLPHGGA